MSLGGGGGGEFFSGGSSTEEKCMDVLRWGGRDTGEFTTMGGRTSLGWWCDPRGNQKEGQGEQFGKYWGDP